MSIDWITVAAQVANFLVLVWLLKRFLYRPILDGIDAREAEITDRMQEAVLAKERADAEGESYRQQRLALQAEQSDLNDSVLSKAEGQRDQLLAEARARLEQERTSWQTHLDEEGRNYSAKLHRAGSGALLSLIRKALNDLADETLEGRMAHHLAQKITSMTPELRRAAGNSRDATVFSRDPLQSAAKAELTASVADVFPNATLAFEPRADQAPGLVLRLGGAQVAWTVDTYVDGLQGLMDEQLSVGSTPHEAYS